MRVLDRRPLSAGRRFGDDPVDQLGGLLLAAANPASAIAPCGAIGVPVASLTELTSAMRREAVAKSPPIAAACP